MGTNVFINYGQTATYLQFIQINLQLSHMPADLYSHHLIHIPREMYISEVGENIIATIKMQNNFWYPLKKDIFQILR